MLEFRILGPLEVVSDDVPLALGGQKQRALLALLLVRANDVVPTERLIEELWGDSAPRTAATSLQNFVSQLRKTLGPDVLETRAPGYRLRVTPDQLDLTRFERAVREARAAGVADRARLLTDALDLWRGTPLADFAYEAFAQNEIRRLEELRLAVIEERLAAELELERHGELVPELESLVAEHPHRERLRGLLMLALYRAGRQTDALHAFHEARRALIELGIEPGPELQRLQASILRQESGLERVRPTPATDSMGDVTRALLGGRLVPVLGPRAEAIGAPDLVEHLTKAFGYDDRVGELTRVSQYVATINGQGPLYDALHELYTSELAPAKVHRFLASLPARLRDEGAPHQLIVTTAYDLTLEQAFTEAGEEFDVVAYLASGRNRGKFLHLAPDGPPTIIDVPNTYATELSLERRTIILRLHGWVDRDDGREWESFVVTEDDYIAYVASWGDLPSAIPVGLAARLKRSHFLFLGYALRDWHLRLLLNRLWGDEKVGYRSWSVQPDASQLETEFWRRRDVDVFEVPLDEYVQTLEHRLEGVAV